MDKDKSMLSLAIITAFMAMAVILPGLIHAGDLEPPDPPGSTMHTVDEIYNKVDEVVSVDCGYAPAAKTGQTRVHAAGDDGDLRKGVTWPNPRFTDNNDGTVTDNLTGLMWLKDASCLGQPYWEAALDAVADLNVNPGNYSCADYVANHGDWRLPSINELRSLAHYGFIKPALPNTAGTGQWREGDPFTNVQIGMASRYWSSTLRRDTSGGLQYCLELDMYTGRVDCNMMRLSGPWVWPVRGGNN